MLLNEFPEEEKQLKRKSILTTLNMYSPNIRTYSSDCFRGGQTGVDKEGSKALKEAAGGQTLLHHHPPLEHHCHPWWEE